MQKRSSDKVLPQRHTQERFGQKSALQEARAAVENALIHDPEMPVHLMVGLLMENAEEDLTLRLRVVLERQFYLRTIRSQRQKQAAASRAQLTLPGFPHLPMSIPGPKGAPIDLVDANYRRVRDYYWSLRKAHAERGRKDPRIQEAFDLMEKMRAASQKEWNITVRQVLLLEQF